MIEEPATPESTFLITVRTLRRIVAVLLTAVVILGLASRAYDDGEPAGSGRDTPPGGSAAGMDQPESISAARSVGTAGLDTAAARSAEVGAAQGGAGRPFGVLWDLLAIIGGRGSAAEPAAAPSEPAERHSAPPSARPPPPRSDAIGGAEVSSLQRWVERDVAPNIQTEVKELLNREGSRRPRPPPLSPSQPPPPPGPHEGLLGFLDCDCAWTEDNACPGSAEQGTVGWAGDDGSECFEWCCCTCEWTAEWACPQRPGKPVPPGPRGYAADDGGPCFSYCCDDPDNRAAEEGATVGGGTGGLPGGLPQPSVQAAAVGGLALVGGVGLLALGAG